MPALSVRHGSDNGVDAIALAGEADLNGAKQIRAALERAIESGKGPVRLDLEQLTFMDSTSLGLLVEAHTKLGRQGRELIVTCTDGPVSRLLTITGLADHMNVIGPAAPASAGS